MPPETARKLEEIYQLTKENNHMLHKMRRAAFWHGVWRSIWFLVIIGAPIAIYYYLLQPYVEQMLLMYGQIQSDAQEVQNFSISDQFQEFLKKYGIGN